MATVAQRKHRSKRPEANCVVCERASTKRCSRCKVVRYCSDRCQVIDWRMHHKQECHPPTNADQSQESGNHDVTVAFKSKVESLYELFDEMESSLGTHKSETLLEKLKSLYSNVEGLPPDQIVPTVGLNVGRIEALNEKLILWDLGGQISLRTIWEKYYEEAHAVIFVIDASCPSSFEDSKAALAKVLRHEDLHEAPVLILANKQDLPGAASAEELSHYLDLKELGERQYMFEAVSAYDGMGIKFAIDWLVKIMERSKRTDMLRMRAGVDVQV